MDEPSAITPYPRGPMVADVRARLAGLIETLGEPLGQISLRILNSDRFMNWPGSVNKHHAWPGGLAQHTMEMTETGKLLAERGEGIDVQVVVTACLWHDVGKVEDIIHQTDGEFAHGEHYRLIYHVSSSFQKWEAAAAGVVDDALRMKISHCILAHHGERRFGSPVEPQTPEARIVHLADRMSAWVYQDHPPAKH